MMIERIMMEAVKFQCVTGKQAKSVYLGKVDFDNLVNDKDEYMAFRQDTKDGRCKVCGLDIFVVDAGNHFNVG